MPTRSTWSGFDFPSLAGTKALVTGGAGFIGSHLAIALDLIGVQITVLDDLSAGGDPQALPASVDFVHGSILDRSVLEKCITGRQFIFHQAALGSVPRSVEQPRLFHDVNVTGTLNVLEAARHAGVKRVMFAASSSAYGDSPTLPKIETMPAIPRSPYAANKVACEAMLSAFAASYSIDTVNLRYFNIFGPRQSPDNAYAAVIAAFAKALLKGSHPQIYGDGEQSRDFTFIDNVVLANLLAAARESPLNGVVLNVACGQRVTVTELAREMARLLAREDLAPIYREERAGDVKHSLADLTAIGEQLGYNPIVPFRDGLAKTVAWYKSVLVT